MEDVGDGEVVAEGGNDEGDGGQDNESEDNYARATGGLAQTLPHRVVLKEKGNQTHTERIDAQRQCDEQGKATNCRHVGRTPIYFSRNPRRRQPEPGKTRKDGRTGKTMPGGHGEGWDGGS